MEQGLVTEEEEKSDCTSVYGMDVKTNSKVLTKEVAYFDHLRHWKNTDINRIWLFDFL